MRSFIDRLTAARIGRTTNFYREGAGAARRRERLAAYLDAHKSAEWLLVGEAPGYRGARISGVPFTSERQLSGFGPAEATATIVHVVSIGRIAYDTLGGAYVRHPSHGGGAAFRAGLRVLIAS